jgi:uncharacterized protein (DUF1015 family)
MVMLRAFRALRYNAAAVGDLAAVVAPPYDVISDAHRDALYARSPYNVVRLILNRDPDRYTAAADAFRTWRRDGLLVRDPAPTLYYHVENFALTDGSPCQREGIIGVVRLEPFNTGRIRPHERTFARAKEDRMRILRACRANLSPIFGLYAEKTAALDSARALAAARPADIALEDDAGVRHRMWMITAPEVIATVTDALGQESIFIADGHHRYETALAYRDEQRAAGVIDAEAAHNFILMYLASMSDPGLVILPTHRVLSNMPGLDTSSLLAQLRGYFRLAHFPRAARQEALAGLRQQSHRGRFAVALAGSQDVFVASPENRSVIEAAIGTVPPVVRALDVTVLDTLVLRGLLGIDCAVAAEEGRLRYTHDDAAALDAVERGDAQVAFLMNPPRISDVRTVCLAGETMPEKSTYFYPKLLTGLVFHPFDEEVEGPRSKS